MLRWIRPRLFPPPLAMELSSSAFPHNGPIPVIHTCDGHGLSLPLLISDVPVDTVTLALIVNDPDAPGGSFIHWTMWNIDPQTRKVEAGTLPAGAVEGVNSAALPGYIGPCPPSGTHHYECTLYALSRSLLIPPSSTVGDLRHAMDNAILGEEKLVGTYSRVT